jgi:flavin-dependent dehydrogenase
VAVVGGGPAGSLFALYFLHYAGERGIHPEITLYQQRDFDKLGPKGCKGCAGIMSASLIRNLSELGLSLPEEIIQSKIERYTIHSPYTSLSINKPEEEREIASIYRGGGPRISHYENLISLDGWLLRQAQRQGARVENQKASRIYLESGASVEVAGSKLAYDLVVLASGVSTNPIPVMGLEYIPPKIQGMAQDELYAGTDQVESRLGNMAHVFLLPHSGLIFGTLVPKGPFINVSVLSSSKHPVSVADFLSYDIVASILPDHYELACGCRPRIVVGAARNYYADRFVAVGDAAVSRLYKDGMGSSLLTAREAARTVVHHGLSRQDFQRYYQPLCRTMDGDNWWGRRLFSVHDRAKDSRAFLLAQHRLVEDEQAKEDGPQPFTKVIWGMFTGSYNYRSIARMALGPASLVKFLVTFLRRL